MLVGLRNHFNRRIFVINQKSPAKILQQVAAQYDLRPDDVLGYIYKSKAVYMAARAFVRELSSEYPYRSERWIARCAHRHITSVRAMMRDETPDRLEDLRKMNSWGDRDSVRLADLVNSGASGPVICAEFGITYPENRNIAYAEIARLVEARQIRRGRLGHPRSPVDPE